MGVGSAASHLAGAEGLGHKRHSRHSVCFRWHFGKCINARVGSYLNLT